MTLKTELPTNSLLPLTTIQRQTQNILPTRIYRQLKYAANDNKLPTTVSVSEENFSLFERIKSVPVHFKDTFPPTILDTCNWNRTYKRGAIGIAPIISTFYLKKWHPPTLPLKRKFDATNP